MPKINIILREKTIWATLNDDSRIAGRIYDLFPITAKIDTWGDELYFPFFLDAELDSPVEIVNEGDIAYSSKWESICLFYGKTPVSCGNEVIPNGPVEVVGKVDGDPMVIRELLSGFVREKRRRLFNRFSILNRFAEGIMLDKI